MNAHRFASREYGTKSMLPENVVKIHQKIFVEASQSSHYKSIIAFIPTLNDDFYEKLVSDRLDYRRPVVFRNETELQISLYDCLNLNAHDDNAIE